MRLKNSTRVGKTKRDGEIEEFMCVIDTNYHLKQELFEKINELTAEKNVLEPSMEQSVAAFRTLIRLISSEQLMDNVTIFCTIAECTASLYDGTVYGRFAIQFGLVAGALAKLGTAYHHDTFLPEILNLETMGCFAMTEIGHGSDVQQLETQATYDSTTQEFVLTTPSKEAIKWWAGQLGTVADIAIVWAQLYIDGSHKGVHAFLVPLRDTKGVHRGNIGLKMGANAMDNGYLCLDHVRIPRVNMLDRFSQVSTEGKYLCELRPGKRFAESMNQFILGRIAMGASSLTNAAIAMTIAARYSTIRQAFGRPLIEYTTHQTQLVSLLSTHMAYLCLKSSVIRKYDQNTAQLHASSCAMKAMFADHAVNALTICRRLVGGHGYSACNRFGPLRDAQEAAMTVEGDNTVLQQQVTRMLLLAYKSHMTGKTDTIEDTDLLYIVSEEPHTGTLLDLIRSRNQQWLQSVAGYLLQDAAQSWNQHLIQICRLGHGHGEYLAAAAFNDALSHSKTPECMQYLCEYYQLSIVLESFPELMNLDLIPSSDYDTWRSRQMELVQLISPNLLPLINAFRLPDGVVQAPIGLEHDTETVYERYIKANDLTSRL